MLITATFPSSFGILTMEVNDPETRASRTLSIKQGETLAVNDAFRFSPGVIDAQQKGWITVTLQPEDDVAEDDLGNPGAKTVTNNSASGTVSTDASAGTLFRYTLTGDVTLANPVNAIDGQLIIWELIQDGQGGRALTLDTNFAFGTDLTNIVASTSPGLRDFLAVHYNASTGKFYVTGFIKGY